MCTILVCRPSALAESRPPEVGEYIHIDTLVVRSVFWLDLPCHLVKQERLETAYVLCVCLIEKDIEMRSFWVQFWFLHFCCVSVKRNVHMVHIIWCWISFGESFSTIKLHRLMRSTIAQHYIVRIICIAIQSMVVRVFHCSTCLQGEYCTSIAELLTNIICVQHQIKTSQ